MSGGSLVKFVHSVIQGHFPPKENPKIPVPSQNFSTPAKKKFRFPPQNTNFLEIHLTHSLKVAEVCDISKIAKITFLASKGFKYLQKNWWILR